jgi:hypothetical protein
MGDHASGACAFASTTFLVGDQALALYAAVGALGEFHLQGEGDGSTAEQASSGTRHLATSYIVAGAWR